MRGFFRRGPTGPPGSEQTRLRGTTGPQFPAGGPSGYTGSTGMTVAIDYARLARDVSYLVHNGQTRKDGSDFFYHPVRVANKLRGADHASLARPLVVAYLHDVLEDTDFPAIAIRALFGGDVTLDVADLTRNPGESYDDYIDRLVSDGSNVALLVKLADVWDNTNCDGDFPGREALRARYIKTDAILRHEARDRGLDLRWLA